MSEEYIVTGGETGMRLDMFVSEMEPGLSRTYVQKLVGQGLVTVNGAEVKSNHRLRDGDRVAVTVPPPAELELLPEPIPLDVYYEDQDLIVVNKPRGMVVHPAEGNYTGTLVNALLYHCRDLSGINGILRPGIVHRIDKETSGLLMAAKNDLTHEGLAEQLRKHTVTRGYVALAHGLVPHNRSAVDAPIGRNPSDRQRMAVNFRNGKRAVTRYRVLDRKNNFTLLDLRLETGRTHQIRVHMSYIGHPLAGDTRYGPARDILGLRGQFLHAYRLGFIHPRTGEYLEFRAPLPEELQIILTEKVGMNFSHLGD